MKRFSVILLAFVLVACSKDETTSPARESSSGNELSTPSPLDERMTLDRMEAVYSIYLHPLESLSEAELRSAVSQVVMLVQTFGTTYSSAGIVFGGGAQQP